MLHSVPKFEVDFQVIPRWVSIMLVIMGTVMVYVGDTRFDAFERLRVLHFALLILLIAGVSWSLEKGQSPTGRWFIVLSLVVLIYLAVSWLNMPGFLVLLALPATLALILINPRAAIVIMLIETSLLLLMIRQSPLVAANLDLMINTLITIWAIPGLVFAIYRRSYEIANWSWSQFQEAQRLLDEARDQKVELKQTQQDLMLANRELALLSERLTSMRLIAEEAQKAKAAFVAKISHEFRTPLNMIIGLIDTLTEAPEVYAQELPPILLKDLEIVRRNSQHLTGMINDVLALSQAEAGQLILHREWVDLTEDIQNAVIVVNPLLEKKNLTLHLSVQNDLPRIYCDRTRIRQVVLNLVSNAARYTKVGGLRVEAAQQGSHIVVCVADTGPGIAPDDVDRIFEPFQQGESGIWRDQEGSGLGLSISKQFIERHGGQIWLDSQLGVGSTFSFKLPISPDLPPSAGPERWIGEEWVFRERAAWPKVPQLPYKQRIVLCDETGLLYPVFSSYSDEIEFVAANNLSQLTKELLHCPAHAVIFTVDSPNNLGPLIDRARQDIPDTPLIGCYLPPPIDRALEARANDYLIKPITQADLQEAIDSIGAPIRQVLIVDDKADIRDLFRRMLLIYDSDLEITMASCGLEALREIRYGQPDLVLLDVIMPDMDGWQILEYKNNNEDLKDIPVIIISAEDPAQQAIKSNLLLASMGAGLSVDQLLRCSVQFSKLMLEPVQELGLAPE